MNKNNVLNIAEHIFRNIIPTQIENVYRGELFIESKEPAGIYYFDFSDNINKTEFKEYQENLLAKEYFGNPGNLQWNYYLLLFQDHFDHKKKQEIETDDKYARKFVFTEKEFKDFFNLESSSSLENNNIVLEWKKNLDSVELQEVYGTASISSAIKRFFQNKTEKQEDKRYPKTSKTNPIKIENIKNLNLTDKYRPFPIDREFEFKKVNLIKGINGVGKTSLLEAIELILCGTTKRNPEKYEPDNAIQAIINDSKTVKYTPSQNEVYRKRDLYWYTNSYYKNNFLYQSFNRYNFFNSDAAFHFSNSDKDIEIKEALLNIVLGSEYNYITDRAEKFFGYIKTELNAIKKEANILKKTIKDAKSVIKSSSLNNNLKLISEKVIENLTNLKLKKVIKNIEKNYVAVKEINNEIKSIIEKLKENSNYPGTRKELKDQLVLFMSQKKIIEKDIRRFEDILNDEFRIQSELAELTRKLSILQNCIKYFSEKKLFELDGFSSNYEITLQRINRIKHIEKVLDGIDINSYKKKISLKKYLEEKNIELKKLQEKNNSDEKLLKENLEKLNKIEKVIKEIKLLGSEFLALNKEATECPLCQSNFEKDELRARIETLLKTENAVDSSQIQILHDDLINSNNEIEIIKVEINDVNKIETAYLAIYPDQEFRNEFLLDIIISIQKINNEIIELNDKKIELDKLKAQQQIYNVSEKELYDLKGKLKHDFKNLELIYENKDSFIKKRDELQKEIDDRKVQIEKVNHEKIGLAHDLKNNLGIEIEKKSDVKNIQSNLQQQENKFNSMSDLFDRLSELLNLNESDSINDFDLLSSILSKNIEALISELKNQFEIKAATIRKEEAEQALILNEKKLNKLEKATKTLKSLVSNDGNKQLEEFFNQNLIEITDIFKTIHVPKEFVNIQFTKRDLYLIDTNNKERKISQISTGQRSALAISIFISLNRKLKNGPNIIMFDDPVSFIDDFNALSFLDFLRYFILMEKRQIFFATASTKLASLFEKKFQFLEGDFKIIPLTRNI